MATQPGPAAEAVRMLLEDRPHGSAAQASEAEVDAAWSRVRERIGVERGAPSNPTMWRVARGTLLRMAATLVVGLGAVYAIDAYTRNRVPEVRTVVSREVRTARGERRPVVLADGTRVVLAPESHLSYPSAFSGGVRSVELEGQGYLEVAPDVGYPFRVKAGDAQITVLGTRFVIRAYPDEVTTKIAVAEGSVSLARSPARTPDETTSSSVVLEAGDLGRLGEDGGEPVRIFGGADDRHFGWLQDRLVFRDATMSSVLTELSRFYDIDLRAPAAIQTRRVTFSIDDQPHDEVLDLLSRLLDLQIRRDGHVVHLEPTPH